MRGRTRWIIGLSWLACVAIVFVRAELKPREGVSRIANVELAPAVGDAPPTRGAAAWRAATLPWDWQPRGDGRDVWCRAAFSLAGEPTEPVQLLIGQVAFGADLFVNGARIAATGRGAAGGWGRREPVWLAIPARDLRAGENELLLRLRVRPEFAGYLTPLFVGPAQALQGGFRARSAVTSGPDALVLVAATLAMVYFAVYRRLRRGEWAWLCTGMAVLAVGGLPFRTADFWLWPLALALATICVVCGAHRAGALERRALERAGFAAIAALGAVAALGPRGWLYPLALLAATLLGAAAIYLLALYRTESVKRWFGDTSGLQLALALAILWGSNDLPLFWNHAPNVGLPLLPIAHFPLLVASFVHVTGYLADGLERSVALNRSLQESQSRLLALERERATRVERERVQRELHDGVGAQLIAALAAAEREPRDDASLARALQLAIGELRGAVDSLDDGPAELLEALGAMRSRLEPLVRVSGARFAWRVGEVETQPSLTHEQILHLLRILQEAITNAVKHSGARTIEVASGAEARGGRKGAFVEVRDDGGGTRAPGVGRGIANMRQRASLLGGELSIESSAAGTCVRLWLAAPETIFDPPLSR